MATHTSAVVRALLISAGCALAIPCTVPVAALAQAPGHSDSLSSVLASARAYVGDYERKLTFVLADERYTQQIRDQVPLDESMPQGRTMKSQIYYLFAPQTGTWMAVRDVMDVDGQAVADRPDLLAMLGTLPAAQVDATVKARNSRFNVGRTIRTFNEPTLALELLEPKRSAEVTFRLTGTRSDHGVEVATLAFHEQGPSTLLHDLSGRAAPSTGAFLVEVGTGAVRTSRLTVRIDPVAMSLTTDYARDGKLNLWVPFALHERYEQGIYGSGADSRVPGSGHEEVRCEATYSNFRRFEVKGGIKR